MSYILRTAKKTQECAKHKSFVILRTKFGLDIHVLVYPFTDCEGFMY